LRGCLQSLSGVPCRISRIDGKTAFNVLSLEPHETATPKFNEDFFAPSYKSWLKADAGKGFALIPRFIRVDRDYLEVKTIGEETKDTFKVEIQEPYTLLKGRVALVTGAAQGFGYEIATLLASSGSIVFFDDINSEGVDSLSKEMNARYGEGATYPLYADVTKEGDIFNMFERIVETVGGIDLVVSNVGVLKAYSILDQPLDDFEFVTKHNYIAFMLVAKHSANIMKKQWEQSPRSFYDIIQINSKSGLTGSSKNGAYAGSKFGSIGLVQSFAMELGAYNIKVNAICPGNFLDGPLWSDPINGLFAQYLRINKVPGAKTIAEVRKVYEAKVPLGKRGCEGLDVFKAVRYLVDQCYETGQALPVSGGQLMLS
jgi:sorbitol-6-phosphate 2-dehydrogenase